ncbi:copper resistance protein CopC [Planococcus lenghuensis]|uniref:Copper resistance protein CopC n=1 Tax=Planococcus lenghuensis TaxID=2213202 RepID=A0A1Q2KYN5_9BACL|nr:copper resistance protein CopC [Planococcus lenghuensis]AQQ53335.1 hypothetical protein B0X71_09755 [Planococcus lenghuensis]
MIKRLSGAFLAAVTLLGLLLPGVPALAHSTLEDTYPETDAALTENPETLEFWFRDPVSVHAESVRLVNGLGEPLPVSPAEIDPADATHIVSRVPGDLPPGTYTAIVNVIAPDGYVVEEELKFRVTAPKQADAPAPAEELKLLRYSPDDGDITTGSPETLEFWFNQPATLTAVGVFDDQQQPFFTTDPVVDPNDSTHLTVEFTEPLHAGTYQVTWYARPADPDALQPDTLDVFYFAVDEFTPITQGSGTAVEQLDLFESAGIKQIGYWLWFTGMAALFGVLFFNAVILPGHRFARWRRVSLGLWVLAAAGVAIVLLTMQADLGNLSARQFLSLKFVWVPLVQLALLALALFTGRAGAVLGGVAIVLTPLVTGHSAYPQYGGVWSIAASSLHLLAVAGWIGGLLALILLPRKQEMSDVLLAALPRYSNWALGSLVLITATGIYMTFAFVPSFSAASFLESEWGKTVMIKLAVTILIAIVGFLQRRTIKRLSAQAVHIVATRGKAEVVYGIIALLAASLLVVSTPKAAEQGLYPVVATAAGLELHAELTPLEAGLNVLTLTFDGQEVTDAEVVLSMPPRYEVGYDAFHTGANEFKVTGNLLHAAGTMDMTVIAVTADGEETTFPFRVVVPGEMRFNE